DDPALRSFPTRRSSDLSDGDGGAESAALDACYDTHVAAIEREYFQAHVPTGAERDALFAEFAECLESFGIHGAIPSWTEHQVVRSEEHTSELQSREKIV